MPAKIAALRADSRRAGEGGIFGLGMLNDQVWGWLGWVGGDPSASWKPYSMERRSRGNLRADRRTGKGLMIVARFGLHGLGLAILAFMAIALAHAFVPLEGAFVAGAQ